MSEQAKAARSAMKDKAKRMCADPHKKVDASSWQPEEMMDTEKKTGGRPVPRKYKRGGKVNLTAGGEKARERMDRMPRKAGGRAKRDSGGLVDPRAVAAASMADSAGRSGVSPNRMSFVNKSSMPLPNSGMKTGGKIKRASGGSIPSDYKSMVADMKDAHSSNALPDHAAEHLMYGDMERGDRKKFEDGQDHELLKDRVNKLQSIASSMGVKPAKASAAERKSLDEAFTNHNYHRMSGHPEAHKAYALMKAIAQHKKDGGEVRHERAFGGRLKWVSKEDRELAKAKEATDKFKSVYHGVAKKMGGYGPNEFGHNLSPEGAALSAMSDVDIKSWRALKKHKDKLLDPNEASLLEGGKSYEGPVDSYPHKKDGGSVDPYGELEAGSETKDDKPAPKPAKAFGGSLGKKGNYTGGTRPTGGRIAREDGGEVDKDHDVRVMMQDYPLFTSPSRIKKDMREQSKDWTDKGQKKQLIKDALRIHAENKAGRKGLQYMPSRVERKHGGKTKGTNVNIVIATKPDAPMGNGPMMSPPNQPAPPPVRPVPVAPAAGMPGAMPAGMPPAAAAPAMPMPPMARKEGGRVGNRKYYSYKDMDAGGLSGLGRLEKTQIQEHKR